MGECDQTSIKTNNGQYEEHQRKLPEKLGGILVITYLTPSKWDTYLIHILTHHGTRWRGERLKEKRQAKGKGSDRSTYYMACFQVNASKLLTAATGGCDYGGVFHMHCETHRY